MKPWSCIQCACGGTSCKLYSMVHENLGSKCRQRSANVCKISACGVVDVDRLVACSHKSGQFSVKNPHLVKISFLPAARWPGSSCCAWQCPWQAPWLPLALTPLESTFVVAKTRPWWSEGSTRARGWLSALGEEKFPLWRGRRCGLEERRMESWKVWNFWRWGFKEDEI